MTRKIVRESRVDVVSARDKRIQAERVDRSTPVAPPPGAHPGRLCFAGGCTMDFATRIDRSTRRATDDPNFQAGPPAARRRARPGLLLAAMILLLGLGGFASQAQAGVGGDDAGTCVNACGGYGAGNNDNSCYCDSACTGAGDCCADYQPVCNTNTGCSPNSGGRYILHVGGMCSQGWDDALASKSGYTSIDVKAVQTNHSGLADSSHTLGIYLDQCCTGSNLCYVLNYSGGDAVMGHRFANSGTNWNINWVGTSAGAGGGSALSGNFLADIFGPCDYSGHLGKSEVRNAYNHNDTNGETNYHIGGHDGWWYTSWLLAGEDDGAVAFHSAGAVSYSTGTSSMCKSPKYQNHVAAWTCSGYNEDHYEMKDRFIQNMGW